MKIRIILAVVFLAAAALLTGMKSIPTDTEFSCNGLKLGDSYTAMENSFGKPWYSENRRVYGRSVDYYVYHDKTVIGIAKKTGEVVDITVSNRKYFLPQGVKIGATPYKMQSVFGKGEKEFVDGKIYFVYNAQSVPQQRLLLQLDSMEDFLVGVRLTTLPLDDEEADAAMYDDDVDKIDELNNGDIDTSAVTSAKKQDAAAKIRINYEKSW
ncbi:hypothetical protein [Pectinatus haikarae]|uniref:Uncharacterized protein n=1 Tax=Pectinatus haikarae TaxID=349096 RepID=A0ABT9Y6C3_9FIRM|nr:hypothetical protein [Pectinatus haikarae]MDQ0203188.1 hypothetical protein [Pectinatus haikarae]